MLIHCCVICPNDGPGLFFSALCCHYIAVEYCEAPPFVTVAFWEN